MYLYQKEERISNFGVVGWYFLFICIQILKKNMFANSGEPDQTPQNAASDLGLHCLPLSDKKDSRHIWVKYYVIMCALHFLSPRY